MKIRILDICTECEICVGACPEVFELSFGEVIVTVDNIPAELEDTVEDIINECPVEAIVDYYR